jgi:hypothetical protein
MMDVGADQITITVSDGGGQALTTLPNRSTRDHSLC